MYDALSVLPAEGFDLVYTGVGASAGCPISTCFQPPAVFSPKAILVGDRAVPLGSRSGLRAPNRCHGRSRRTQSSSPRIRNVRGTTASAKSHRAWARHAVHWTRSGTRACRGMHCPVRWSRSISASGSSPIAHGASPAPTRCKPSSQSEEPCGVSRGYPGGRQTLDRGGARSRAGSARAPRVRSTSGPMCRRPPAIWPARRCEW